MPPAAGASSRGAGPARGVPPPEAPTLAFFAVFLGGLMVLLQGLVLLTGAGSAFSVGVALAPSLATQFGGVGVTLGIGIVAAGFALHENPGSRRQVGVVTVVLGLLSLVAGGGFLLGLGLSVAGGLMAAFRRPFSLYQTGASTTGRSGGPR